MTPKRPNPTMDSSSKKRAWNGIEVRKEVAMRKVLHTVLLSILGATICALAHSRFPTTSVFRTTSWVSLPVTPPRATHPSSPTTSLVPPRPVTSSPPHRSPRTRPPTMPMTCATPRPHQEPLTATRSCDEDHLARGASRRAPRSPRRAWVIVGPTRPSSCNLRTTWPQSPLRATTGSGQIIGVVDEFRNPN